MAVEEDKSLSQGMTADTQMPGGQAAAPMPPVENAPAAEYDFFADMPQVTMDDIPQVRMDDLPSFGAQAPPQAGPTSPGQYAPQGQQYMPPQGQQYAPPQGQQPDGQADHANPPAKSDKQWGALIVGWMAFVLALVFSLNAIQITMDRYPSEALSFAWLGVFFGTAVVVCGKILKKSKIKSGSLMTALGILILVTSVLFVTLGILEIVMYRVF